MRLFEFAGDDPVDKFHTVLNNFVGRYTSKSAPASLNWTLVTSMAKKAGFQGLSNPKTVFQTFSDLWDNDPAFKTKFQTVIKNFNGNGVQLNIPGAKDEEPAPGSDAAAQDSQTAVDKAAASAAPGQLAQSQATPQV